MLSKITLDFNNIIYNKIFLATISGLIAIIVLYLDKCIFIREVTCISYIKIFILVFFLVFSVLYFTEKMANNNDSVEYNKDINLDDPDF
tara:strand:- start:58 stop:324 length:267 start_codon:yes stop_codon:yes gene_type:complete